MNKKDHFDYRTEDGKLFLVGYRKFIIALFWMALMTFVVLMSFFSKPSAGQITVAIWVIAGSGFFCAFFVGGNVLAKLWANNYKISTQSTLSQQTEQKEIVVKEYQYDPQEDAAWASEKRTKK